MRIYIANENVNIKFEPPIDVNDDVCVDHFSVLEGANIEDGSALHLVSENLKQTLVDKVTNIGDRAKFVSLFPETSASRKHKISHGRIEITGPNGATEIGKPKLLLALSIVPGTDGVKYTNLVKTVLETVTEDEKLKSSRSYIEVNVDMKPEEY